MKISNIKENNVFETVIENRTINQLFHFFQHKAPTIKNVNALDFDKEVLNDGWKEFTNTMGSDKYLFISSDKDIERYLKDKGLEDQTEVNRNKKGFVCQTFKGEEEYACLLRHIRNSISHGRVYFSKGSKRNYFLFDDYNNDHKQTGRILLSQTDLCRLRTMILSCCKKSSKK